MERHNETFNRIYCWIKWIENMFEWKIEHEAVLKEEDYKTVFSPGSFVRETIFKSFQITLN